MSTRQMRKMKEKEPAANPAPCESDEESEGEERAPFNPFTLLEDDDGSGNVLPEEEEEEADRPDTRAEMMTHASSSNAAKKKKSKEGKKGKKKKGSKVDEEKEVVAPANVEFVDEIDRIVEELKLETAPVAPLLHSSSTNEADPTSLLLIDIKSLRGEDELRRIFGSEVLQGMEREERADAAQGRRQAHALRGTHATRRRIMKKGSLVSPKEHWPPFEGGLEMVVVSPSSTSTSGFKKGDMVLYINRKDHSKVPAEIIHIDNSTDPPQYGIRKEGSAADVILYTEADRLRPLSPSSLSPRLQYRMSPSYQYTQQLFEHAKQSHDPQAIAMILRRSPYHIDSLLQMFELYRSMGENNYAEDCLARSLYALEMGFHPSFDLTSPRSLLLDYGIEENRALFLALFRHVQHLSRQGCHRAAFECCKLLISLEPRDPMGALFLIDYLSLRAGRDEWLIQFSMRFKDGLVTLSTLPNFSFSSSLARFRLAIKGSGSMGEALGQMVLAIQLHPYVVPKLIAHLVDKGSCRESFWQLSLLSKPMFAGRTPEDESNPSLSHLVAIFVERSGLLWKPVDALELLRCASMIAAGLHDKSSPEAAASSASSISMMGSSQPFHFDLSHRMEAATIASGLTDDDWTLVRREAFPPPEQPADKPQSSIGSMMRTFLGLGASGSGSSNQINNYGHLRVEDFTDNVARLPAEEMNAVLQPRRPDVRGIGIDEDDEESMQEIAEQMAIMQAMEQEQGGGGGQQGIDEGMRQMNPLMMMLHTLMPWVNAGQQPNYEEEDRGGGDGDQEEDEEH